MSNISNIKKSQTLLSVLNSVDSLSDDSMLHSVILNKIINYLFMKLQNDERAQFLDVLKGKSGVSILEFAAKKPSEEEIKFISESVKNEVDEVYFRIINTDKNGIR